MTPPEAPKDGEQLLQETVLTAEKNWAKRIGNSERFQETKSVEFFGPARQEWLDAWKRFFTAKGLGSLFDIHAGVGPLEPEKAFTLASLRFSKHPDEILRKRASVIEASRKDDPRFSKKLRLAQRSGRLRQDESGFLPYSILIYWFTGLRWLMNDKTGAVALRAYTGKWGIGIDAYRKARGRLGLNGYRGHVKAAPVLEYDPKTRRYEYGAGWTKLEPN